jgi:hypothetical protein
LKAKPTKRLSKCPKCGHEHYINLPPGKRHAAYSYPGNEGYPRYLLSMKIRSAYGALFKYQLGLTGERRYATVCNTFEEVLGYSPEVLLKHISGQFDEHMSWQNWGDYWQLDHIKPHAAFRTDDFRKDVRESFHWANLRPLEKRANMSRSKHGVWKEGDEK